MVESRHLRRLNLRHSARAIPHAQSRPKSLTWVALLALAIQLFVVQTHIHGTPFGSAVSGITASGAAGGSNSPDRFPVKEDPSNCPLCQEFAHSGGYLHSTHIIEFIPFAKAAERLDSETPLPGGLHLAHFWFGRAPPAALALNG